MFFLLVFPLGYLVSFVQGIFSGNYSMCIPFILQKAAVFGIGYFVVFFLLFACQGKRGEHWRSLLESVSSLDKVAS